MGMLRFRPSLLALALALAPVAATQAADEPWNSGWAFYADNDLFVPGAQGRDRDYTGGFSLTLSGRQAREALLSLDTPRAAIGRWLGSERLLAERSQQRHSIEYGLTVFTPGDLSARTLQTADRPFASLLYVSSTAAEVDEHRGVALMSTLTFGVLGAPFVADIQKGVHQAFGSTEPQGWDEQISDGGELTARYSLARTVLSARGAIGNSRYEVTQTWRASAGYLSDVSFGMAARIGELRSPWWSYNPQVADYAEKSVPVAGGGAEHYWWGGFAVHARLYNAFLQGQFRDSRHHFSHDELRPLIAEVWAGYTHAFDSGWRLSYTVRGQSSELETGTGDRSAVWGGVVVSQAF